VRIGSLVDILAVCLTLGVLAWASDVVRMLGFVPFTEQYIAVMLAVALVLIYLTVPARKSSAAGRPAGDEGPQRRTMRDVPWYDVLAAAVGFIVSIYVAIRFPVLSEEASSRPWSGLIPAVILLALLLEGLRRTSGMAITIVVVFFFALSLVAYMLPGALAGRRVVIDRVTYFLLWDSSAVLGTVLQIITTIVVSFVFFGNALFKSGGSAFFTDISMALMGRFRGGPAKVAIMASSLFGTISGSVVANVVTTGVVTIPLMKKAGLRPQLAGAIEAVASTGGQLMPPVMGIAAFLMAEFLNVPYAEVALAALIPAVLFYLALFLQADLEAAKAGLGGLDPSELPRVRDVLGSGWFFPIPFVLLIYALFWLNWEPATAALLAAGNVILLSVVFGFKGQRVGVLGLYEMLRDTGHAVIDLFMIGAAAGAVIALLNYSGLGFGLTLALVQIAGGNLTLLLVLAAIACIILGMGMPTVGVYILLATLVAPALIEMKVPPMAAHMFILYFGCLSMITPPVAIGAFAAANLAGADPMKTGFEAVLFGWTVFVIPFLFVFSTTLLMEGHPLIVAVDFVMGIAGVWFGAAGVIGYGMGRLGGPIRVVYVLTGLCLMMPIGAFGAGRWINLAGLAGAAALLAKAWLGRRQPRALAER
jgi:TRAP transporter 4TM/12TM fusion protein